MERSLAWENGVVVALDQRALPDTRHLLHLTSVPQIIEAITSLAVRGAPAVGLAGALGVALSAHLHSREGGLDKAAEKRVRADAEAIAAARPTAVNLRWGVERALAALPHGADAVRTSALTMLEEDERTNRAAAGRAANFLRKHCPDRPLRILTHCNTGRLATAAWGTALGTVRELAASGDVEEVLVDETRPLLQGARLTTWELAQEGIPYRLCVDAAGPAAIAAGKVDCVVVGADRIAANGDVANKVGTYGLAVAADRAGIPFVVVAPESTVDTATASGGDIRIEERDSQEVTHHGGRRLAPEGTSVFNPAFDVTPAALVTAVATESRTLHHGQDLPDRIRNSLETIEDFPRSGISFRDLGGFFASPGLMRDTAAAMAQAFAGRFDHVLALESRGFPIGAVVAQHSEVPLILARKPGKLPGLLHGADYGLEYGKDRLEIRQGVLDPGARVLIVDDVLATGGTLQAAATLVECSGAEVSGCATVVELGEVKGRERLAVELFTAVNLL